jgi:hypothetical protein
MEIFSTVQQIVTVIDNEKNQQLQTLLQLQRQVLRRINVVIGEADNCTANPVVAWVATSTGSCPVTVTRIK